MYLDQGYVPRTVLVPVEFPDREVLGEMLSERTGHRVEILVPQRGEKRSLVIWSDRMRNSRSISASASCSLRRRQSPRRSRTR